MNRVRVHRQAREPDVVGGEDGSAERMLVDVADLEVLEHAARSIPVFDAIRSPLPRASRAIVAGVEAELLENRVGVLAERRHGAHHRLDAVDARPAAAAPAAGRRASRSRASGRAPASCGWSINSAIEFMPRVRDVGRLEPLDDLVRRERARRPRRSASCSAARCAHAQRRWSRSARRRRASGCRARRCRSAPTRARSGSPR